ncbi:hypothetical protein HXX76_002327 [Chlamydomonas incerta]|uniref:Cytochrome P450 n=1 Tax=Chlamydomonas incerta TaxID=51695 RepID=A0A835VN97_CHLIN|nr:hypothetical protein HXX76_002327 [Chlamydomonas incerta]|eukprot:KAG2423102.1 hypothetical protein HXX76_002327 [Chlamydomonas incerta]
MTLLQLLLGVPLALLGVLALPVVITLVQEIITKRKYRHIPGPKPSPISGNLREFLTAPGGLLGCLEGWVKRYGDLITFRLGSRQFVLVADPDAARNVMVRLPNHAAMSNPNMHLTKWDLRSMDVWGLLMARDDYWRGLRAAWQPAFSPASLRGYQALMDREALALAGRLRRQAAAAAAGGGGGGGPKAGEVEVMSEMSRVTLAVVGTAAYGVDFNAPEYGGSGAAAPGSGSGSGPGATLSLAASLEAFRSGRQPSLVSACNDFFRTMSPSARSTWSWAVALPCLLPAIRHVAAVAPDPVLGLHIQSRRVLRQVSTKLITAWRDSHTPASTSSTTSEGAATANGVAATADAAAAAAAGSSSPGVAPGSFLGLMLAARDRSRREGGGKDGAAASLTDAQIEAQVQTFLLAGFETTANALTFAVYLLASHPEAAARLRAEVDAHLPPLAPLEPEQEGGQAEQGSGGAAASQPLSLETLDKLLYTEAVLNEALRLFPPAHATTRETDKDMTIQGAHIPAGTTLWLSIAHLHTRDGVWPEPQAFRPERFLPPDVPGSAPELAPRHPHAHLPFGSGPRMCIGWRFAMQEAKTVLSRLVQAVEFSLAPGQAMPLDTVAGLTLAPRHGVWVRLSPRGAAGGRGQAAAAAAAAGKA